MELFELFFGYGSVASVAAWLGYEYANFRAAKAQAKLDEVYFVTETAIKHSDGVSLTRTAFGVWPEWADEVNPARNSPKPLTVADMSDRQLDEVAFAMRKEANKNALADQMDELLKKSYAPASLSIEPKVTYESNSVGNSKNDPWENAR